MTYTKSAFLGITKPATGTGGATRQWGDIKDYTSEKEIWDNQIMVTVFCAGAMVQFSRLNERDVK